uniref:Uncharacterized protein n=1 Tax=Setaria italica TaxID=4555 RepID=K3XUB4_SETIT
MSECRVIPLAARFSLPPCSRSTTTTASVTTSPSARSGAAVSSTDAPLVTRSSMMRTVSPALYDPSMDLAVPCALTSLRRMSMGMLRSTERTAAMGSAV